jgi:GTP cyclohydrolase FolE2
VEPLQTDDYGATILKWREAVKLYGRGWDEDGPSIPVDYPLDVSMTRYHVAGTFTFAQRDPADVLTFTMPEVDILARVTSVKAHMNRLISAVELPARAAVGPFDIWTFLQQARCRLQRTHPGTRYRVSASSLVGQLLEAHCTKLPSTLPWAIRFAIESRDEWDQVRYTLGLRTTVFTVCPFVLFETEGHQSHTQRTHIDMTIEATTPMIARPIMREVTTRLVPVMSNMKIPDEVVQVLKAYAGPTFTEDGAVRVIKILRGITAEFCEGDVIGARVRTISEDSHLAHDVESEIWSDLA